MNSPESPFTPPRADEYHEYYHGYVSKFKPKNFLPEFAGQAAELRSVLGALEPEADTCLHEPYTWTLKEVVGHLIDCERVFSDRLLRIGVGDETPIPGIEQNKYVASMGYESVSMDALLDEFECLRKSNVLLIQRMPPASFDRRGIASNNPITARAILFIMGGHVAHHLEIMKLRLGRG